MRILFIIFCWQVDEETFLPQRAEGWRSKATVIHVKQIKLRLSLDASKQNLNYSGMIAESAKFRAPKRGESTKIYLGRGRERWKQFPERKKNFSPKELNN